MPVEIVAVVVQQIFIGAVFQPAAGKTAHGGVGAHEVVLRGDACGFENQAAEKGEIEDFRLLLRRVIQAAADGGLGDVIGVGETAFFGWGGGFKVGLMIAKVGKHEIAPARV